MVSKLHGKNYYKTIIRNVRLIVKCGICGHKQKIQFHHIKPTSVNGDSRGSNHRYYDIVKHPDAYLPLCYFCHKKVTSKDYMIILTNQSLYPFTIGYWIRFDEKDGLHYWGSYLKVI